METPIQKNGQENMEKLNDEMGKNLDFLQDVDNLECNQNLIEKLNNLSNLVLQDKEWRESLQLDSFSKFDNFLTRINLEFKSNENESFKFQLYTEIFRFCRNCCCSIGKFQEFVGIKTNIGSFAINFLKCLINDDRETFNGYSEDKLLALLIAIQMLYNTISGANEVNRFYDENFNYFEDIMLYSNLKGPKFYKISYCATMTMLEIYKLRLQDAQDNCDHEAMDLLEEAHLNLRYEAMLKFSEFLEKELENFDSQEDLLVLDCLMQTKKVQENMSIPVLKICINYFKNYTKKLLNYEFCEDVPQNILLRTNRFSLLMAELASFEEDKLPVMKEDEDFVKCVVDLLVKVHQFGKHHENIFSRLENLDLVAPSGSGSRKQDLDQILSTHSFNLKSKLIELLTFLCSNEEKNQNIARDHNGLAVILDCTKIDARNPYIPQRSIVALKVLLSNEENREFVRRMDKKGTFENSEILKEFGIRLNQT